MISCWDHRLVKCASPISHDPCRPGNRGNEKGCREALAYGMAQANHGPKPKRSSPTHWMYGPMHAISSHPQGLLSAVVSPTQPPTGALDSRVGAGRWQIFNMTSGPSVLDPVVLFWYNRWIPRPLEMMRLYLNLSLMHPDRPNLGQLFRYHPP